jgi:flap endonuclease-1
MGVAITPLLPKEEVSNEELKNKILAVDAYNLLYQFLSSIRQYDGSLLVDSKGRVTSHLAGLFNRITKLMHYNMKFVFCFDGKVPDLKKQELQRRKELKLEAQKKYDIAAEKQDTENMKKYASRTSRLTSEMIEDAKELITALGHVIIEAPSEGEAQASYLVKNKDADYVVSQDADCLLFGADKIIRNLTFSSKRKRPGSYAYNEIKPEVIELNKVLNELEIKQDQLIVLSILIGTDYNVGGINGIGPKKGLSLVKKYKDNFDKLFKEAKWEEHFDIEWEKIFDTIKNIEVKKDYKIEFKEINTEEVIKVMVEKHDFSEERIKTTLEKLQKSDDRKQKGLTDFF